MRFFLILCVAFVMLFLGFNQHPDYRAGGSDENFYYRYGDFISKHGVQGFHNLVVWYSSDARARFHPTPSRVGYISLIALLFRIFEPSYYIIHLISLLSFGV